MIFSLSPESDNISPSSIFNREKQRIAKATFGLLCCVAPQEDQRYLRPEISASSPMSQTPMSHGGDYESSDSDTEHDSLLSHSSVHGTGYQTIRNGNGARKNHEPVSDRERRQSFIEDDGDPLQIDIPGTPEEQGEKDEPVTWMSLPNKRQLAILVIARLSEPLVQSSLRVCFSLISCDLK